MGAGNVHILRGLIQFNQHHIDYNRKLFVPVLPTTVNIELGNNDQAVSNSTVTITYYY